MFSAILLRIWGSFRALQEQRKAIRRLSMLDDRLLRDIGIGRSEIGYYVRGHAHGKIVRVSGSTMLEHERFFDSRRDDPARTTVTNWPLGLPAGYQKD